MHYGTTRRSSDSRFMLGRTQRSHTLQPNVCWFFSSSEKDNEHKSGTAMLTGLSRVFLSSQRKLTDARAFVL